MSIQAIQSLTLAPLDAPDVAIARARSVGGAASASVDAGSVVAFVAGIAAQDREDVLYSLQLAQRAASGVANRYREVDKWYEEYSRVLELCGWVLRGFAPNEQEVAEGKFEMAKAALTIVAAAATGPAAAVLTAAINALDGMADSDGFITLFEHYGAKDNLGNFQLGVVESDLTGELSMRLGGFRMQMSEHKKKFLFFKWNEKSVKVWADAQTATFNRAHYAELRAQVQRQLGADATAAIAALPLAPLG